MFFFFFCISQLYLWGSPFWVRFLCMRPFFNPTIEVVTLRLCGWCILGVFLLLAFTHLGHECQDLLSLCHRMHVCTDYTSVYTLIWNSFRVNGVRTHANSKGKFPSTGKILRGGSNPWRCISMTVSPTHYQWAIPASIYNVQKRRTEIMLKLINQLQ